MIETLLDVVDGIRHGMIRLGPVVIISQRKLTGGQDAAYELGNRAGALGYVPIKERHLRSV